MNIIGKFLAIVFSIITAFGIMPYTLPSSVVLEPISEEKIDISTEKYGFSYEKGRFSLVMNGNTMFRNAVGEYKLAGEIISSVDYDNVSLAVENVSGVRGKGTRFVATLTDESLPAMKQSFTFYDDAEYFLINTELSSTEEIATNYIAPMVVRNCEIQNANPRFTNFLEVPFDNDGWVEFTTPTVMEGGIGHEVGAFFTPDKGAGLIIGSVNHDKWKSAVEFNSRLGKINELYAYSGANTALTRDQSPHGTVKGKTVASASFFVGFYDNWKDGMREYARVNTTFTAKRESVGEGNPIGWNSWGSIQSDINYEKAITTSDYIKDNFQDVWEDEDNIVYINLDSWWDRLSDDELRAFVAHCEENGQVAGVYSAPFVSWWDEYGMSVNYVADTGYSYNDIRLKKADGTYYGNDIDGCYPLDVTHPATYIHFKNQLERLMSCGFKYIKLDFLVHGSLEGDFYDDSIETGIEAYNFAMGKVAEIIGDDVFINLSMAPIFPYNYANGRRLCCDTYYNIGETEYMMNSLTYGFWQRELYDWIDPDHIVVWGRDGKANAREARSRLLSGIVTGGSFLTGDNFVDPVKDSDKAFERYEELLDNEKLIEVLKIGRPFEAVLDVKCPYAADIFTLCDGGALYVAAFNYNEVFVKPMVIDVPANSVAENLFTGEKKDTGDGKISFTLQPGDCAIYKIVR